MNKFEYEEYKYKNIYIYIYNNDSLEIDLIFKFLNKIPPKLLSNIKNIYYGDNKNLKTNHILSTYNNNSILISNEVDKEELFVQCILHECIHSLSEKFETIKNFNAIKNEFLEKKKIILDKLKCQNKEFYNTIYYNKQIDNYFLKIGYNKLDFLIKNIFSSSYCLTSIIEYVALGCEDLIIHHDNFIKHYCPELYKFINFLGG
jgi:hypothetical protein